MSSVKWRPFCLGLNVLSIVAYWRWANIAWDNGLLPDGTKPLPDTMST